MNYDIFWAKHINKPDTIELGMKVIIPDELLRRLNKGGISATSKMVSNTIDISLVKTKGIPLSDVEVWVLRDANDLYQGYEVGCMVKALKNKGWRNWFPLPVIMRREQFRQIDKVVEEVKLSIQKAIEPLLLDA